MKKLFTLAIALILAFSTCLGLTACKEPEPENTDPTTMTYNSVLSSSAALDELGLGADIAVVDLAYANYYINALGHNELMILSGEDFTFDSELIVAACKKGSGINEYVNYALYQMQQNKQNIRLNNKSEVEYTITDMANEFGIANNLVTIEKPNDPSNSSVWDTLNTLNIGYTAENNSTGNIQILPFIEVGHYGGYDGFLFLVTQSFASIFEKNYKEENVNWENRQSALNEGNYDVIFGNFTKDSFGADDFDFSVPFLTTSTAIVIKTADKEKYTSYDNMKSAKFVAVANSKAETLLKGEINTKIFG